VSVSHPDVIDAVTLRDGWAVLSIYHFDDWAPVEERVEQLRRKVICYLDHVASVRFQSAFWNRPVRIELVSADEPPAEVLAICRENDIVVEAGER